MRKDLERGAAVSVLQGFVLDGAPISVLYPRQRHLWATVRAIIDFLVAITWPA